MKARTIVVEIEMETAATLRDIKESFAYYLRRGWTQGQDDFEIRVNVIRATKRKARGKARRGR